MPLAKDDNVFFQKLVVVIDTTATTPHEEKEKIRTLREWKQIYFKECYRDFLFVCYCAARSSNVFS
jgi:hypothetical protein